MSPLPARTMMAPHFTAHELGADNPEIPAQALGNLYRVAAWLEAARAAFGNVPITVNDGFRTPAHNAAVGGSDTSDHPNGLAADFSVSGWSQLRQFEAYKSGGFPSFDQIIFYQDGHTHVGLGPQMRGEFRVKVGDHFPLLSPDLVATLRRTVFPIGLLLVLVAACGLYALAQRGA